MWPWLPERVAVVHIPCVLTYFLTCNYQLDLSGQRGNLACLCQPLPSPAFVLCLSGASLAKVYLLTYLPRSLAGARAGWTM